jgi:hypothetical protein
MELEAKLQFLRAFNVDRLEHTEKGLLSHLLGTRNLLESWGARHALYDAGLFHSVYGTQAYLQTAVPMSRRDEVRAIIGAEAENLVWLFCVMRRETFGDNLQRQDGFRIQDRISGEWHSLTKWEFEDLVNLGIANTLESLPRFGWMTRRQCRAGLLPYRKAAMPGARQAIDNLAAWRWWQLWK